MSFRVVLIILLLGLAGFATGTVYAMYSTSAAAKNSFLQWNDPIVTSAGRTLYSTNCASCHGMPDRMAAQVIDASGKAPPLHDASGHTWQHPDYALFRLVRDGIAVANCAPIDPELMPKFKGIVTDTELVAILSYIKSTWPEAVRSDHDQVNMMYGSYNRAVRELIGIDAGEHD